MKFLRFLNILDKGNKTLFDISVKEQYAFLNTLPIPQNDIERSYNQFLCSEYFVPKWKKIIWWFVSVFSIPIALLLFWIKGLLIHFEKEIETIHENKHTDDILPEELTSRYQINSEVWDSGIGLSSSDILYIWNNIIGRRQPYYILKAIIKLATYSPKLKKYNPKQVIIHAEYSYCSTMLTDYSHKCGVKLINVMHGEKLRYIRDSFFHFDECYVWDQHYINIFKDQKAEPTQFIVAIPPGLRIDSKRHINKEIYADYKYYLASFTEVEIVSIIKSMEFAKSAGKIVKYRVHPRFSDVRLLKKYIPEEFIEYPSSVNIVDSVSNTTNVVGSYTTVLLQAYLSGKNVIIDDVTYKFRCNQLEEYDYILAKGDIERLSSKQTN